MNKIKYLVFLSVLCCTFFVSAAGEENKPHNRFDIALEYSRTSGFIPAADVLWHYNDTFFSSLYGNYFFSSEKKTLSNYENSKYAVFSKKFVLGSEVLGLYFLKNPALFALSLGLEYQRVKNEEFGFFDVSETTVTFEDTIYQNLILPFIRLTADKHSKIVNNRFLFVFYPSYCLMLEQEIYFNPLFSRKHTSDSSKWQVPAFEISDEILIGFNNFGGILLNTAFSFREARYTSAVLRKLEDGYGFGEAEVRQIFLEYGFTVSYVIPFEIAGTIHPKIGAGLSGSAEFRKNGGKKSTNRDVGYLFVFGFHY
ncbi:hypothetical protein J6Z19_04960 [bacterium]|nr:hypothetical protein [bacterium]